jgi:hypothetical protein
LITQNAIRPTHNPRLIKWPNHGGRFYRMTAGQRELRSQLFRLNVIPMGVPPKAGDPEGPCVSLSI